MKLITILTLCLMLPFTVVAQDSNTHHKNHNDYESWRTPLSRVSCCHDTDCDIVKELGFNQNGEHIVRWRGKVLVVPEHTWLKDKQTPDGNSHACAVYIQGEPEPKIICYVPGKAMY